MPESIPSSLALTREEQEEVRCDLLERLDTPIWFYDFERFAIVWANTAALSVWNAKDVEELAARDLRSEMSRTVEERLRQIREDFENDPANTFQEVWTFYPESGPTAVECVFHEGAFASGRSCTMITGRPVSDLRKDADMIRALDALLHSSTINGLFSMDGRRLFANRAFRARLGSTAKGKRFGEMFIDQSRRAVFLDAVNAGRPWREVVEVMTDTGAQWHDIHVTPCRDAVSGAPAFHLSAFDVTKAQLATDQLKIARDEARNANQAKSEFIANMSHEMRTPMNGVLGLLEVLRVSNLTPQQEELVRIAKASGVALLELIEDILDISSTELRAISLEEAFFDLHEVAHTTVEGLTMPARQKGLDLRHEIDPAVPAMAYGDKRRVAQVIRNLIGNAIKYTERGHILLSFARSDDELHVAVTDTGIGVPEGQVDLIFDRFYQSKRILSSPGDGVGIGLSIVKEIVDLWEGVLTVESPKSGGSCFTFTLPNAFPETVS